MNEINGFPIFFLHSSIYRKFVKIVIEGEESIEIYEIFRSNWKMWI